MSKRFTVTFKSQPGHVDYGKAHDDGTVEVWCPDTVLSGVPAAKYDTEAAFLLAATFVEGEVHWAGEEKADGGFRPFRIKYRTGDHEEVGVQFPNGQVAATCDHMDKPLTFASMDVLEQRFKMLYPTDPGAYSIEWVA